MNYQKIIKINDGAERLTHSDIPDLEIGPNRCAVPTSKMLEFIKKIKWGK